ncbi:hypothetical protein D9M71_795300 [compost metagenome]
MLCRPGEEPVDDRVPVAGQLMGDLAADPVLEAGGAPGGDGLDNHRCQAFHQDAAEELVRHGGAGFPCSDLDVGAQRGKEVGDRLGSGSADHQRCPRSQRGNGTEDGDIHKRCVAWELP